MGADLRAGADQPGRRPTGEPADPDELPRQRRGVTPQMHGRYPEYDVLDEIEHWDAATRRVVLARLEHPRALRFFTSEEADVVGALGDIVTAQDREPRIPLASMIDERLHEGLLTGYQYADMPDDREVWRLIARGLDQTARARGAPSFAAAAPPLRFAITKAFAEGKLTGGVWERLPCSQAWTLAARDILEAFYSHPWAWNEIGFGGPAYPRGYMRLGIETVEPHEGPGQFSLDPVEDVRQRGLQ